MFLYGFLGGCPGNQIPSSCASPCGPNRCRSTGRACAAVCVQGCVCPGGTCLRGNTCV